MDEKQPTEEQLKKLLESAEKFEKCLRLLEAMPASKYPKDDPRFAELLRRANNVIKTKIGDQPR
jgi:hypothetical protein